MEYLITFLEGILTFLSPCVLPMLPVYLLYFMGDGSRENRARGLTGALGFIGGFSLVFLVLGLFAGAIGSWLVRYQVWVNVVTGLVVVFFGLHYLGIIRVGFLQRQSAGGKIQAGSFWSAAAFGCVFAVSWSPCTGAFLGSALMLAASSAGWGKGLQLLACYCLGLGIPFFLCALLTDQLKGALNSIKRHYDGINRFCGIALIGVGILMMTGLFARITAALA